MVEPFKSIPVSCLGSCYANSDHNELYQSILSLLEGSVSPSEIVLVVDGPIFPLLTEVIDFFDKLDLFKAVYIHTNVGLGNALRFGLSHCHNDLVVRFDTDDISTFDRLSVQYEYMINNPSVSVCGSFVYEASKLSKHYFWRFRTKKVPIAHKKISFNSFFVNPLNHPSVIFSSSAVRDIGSYVHMPFFEDYYLWLRMLKSGHIFSNIPACLVIMRRDSLSLRRSGFSYFLNEIHFASALFSGFKFLSFIILFRSFLRPAFTFLNLSLLWRDKSFSPTSSTFSHELRILASEWTQTND